jgi:hypothetical protein
MLNVILSAALAPLMVAAEAPLDDGVQLVFRGSVEPRADDGGNGGKSFDLSLWILEKHDGGAELFWLVDERGRGAFPWSERFGRLTVDRRWRTAGDGPALLYDRGEGRSVVPIPLPFFATDTALAAESEFREGKLEYRVEGSGKQGDQPVWKVSVRDRFGSKRRMMVQQSGPLVPALVEKVIMGRGEEYQLKLELVGTERLTGETLAALANAIEKLTELRGKLNHPARTEEVRWKRQQLALLTATLPAVTDAAAATPLEKLTADAARDFKLQSGRSDSVAELVAKYRGQPIEAFVAQGLGDSALSDAELAGNVTVLHFWDYRDEPLKEPYGQVGYLDYLYHRRGGDGLRVYGVAVDGRLADDKKRAAAEASVRKLKAFMNLSYPLLLDSGPLVKQFGDPRIVGASLPLFVVIGPDQKILHYHVGHYEVHQDRGLKELDEVVAKALADR